MPRGRERTQPAPRGIGHPRPEPPGSASPQPKPSARRPPAASPPHSPSPPGYPAVALHPGRASKEPEGAQAPRRHPAALVPRPPGRNPRRLRPVTSGPPDARSRPWADPFATLLPIKYGFPPNGPADQSPRAVHSSALRPFGSSARRPSALRPFGSSPFAPSALRLVGVRRCGAFPGLPPAPKRSSCWFKFPFLFFSFFPPRHFRVLRRPGSPRVPEAWLAQVLPGKAKLPRKCFRESSVERGVSPTPKVSVRRGAAAQPEVGGAARGRPVPRLVLVALGWGPQGPGFPEEADQSVIWGKTRSKPELRRLGPGSHPAEGKDSQAGPAAPRSDFRPPESARTRPSCAVPSPENGLWVRAPTPHFLGGSCTVLHLVPKKKKRGC